MTNSKILKERRYVFPRCVRWFTNLAHSNPYYEGNTLRLKYEHGSVEVTIKRVFRPFTLLQ